MTTATGVNFPAEANYIVPDGDIITSFSVTITVPQNYPDVPGEIVYYWPGLQPKDGIPLYQPILGFENGHWFIFDAIWHGYGGSFNTDNIAGIGDGLGVPVQPGTTLTMEINQLPSGAYEAIIPGYTSGIIETPSSPLTVADLTLETYGITNGNQLGQGLTFSNIQIQAKDATGHLFTPSVTWGIFTDTSLGVHSTSSATQVAFTTQDGNAPVLPLPSVPVIENFSPSQESVNLTKFIILAGQADTGTSVTVFDGTNKIGTMDVTDGLWSLSESHLKDGVHSFTVEDTNSHGSSFSQPFQVDVETIGHTPIPHAL